MESIEKLTKSVAFVTATVAALTGGYTAWDKITGFHKDKRILVWSPELFKISDGPADSNFKVIVARKKNRNDCSVEGFKLQVRDSHFIMHDAIPGISVFSGAASNNVEKFGYTFKIDKPETVSAGKATLVGTIEYECPEGKVTVLYPNVNFNIRSDK
jgi:hypothetical protein